MWASARPYNRSIARLHLAKKGKKKKAFLHNVLPQIHINLFTVIITSFQNGNGLLDNFGHWKLVSNDFNYLQSENQVFNRPCDNQDLKNYQLYGILQSQDEKYSS